MKRVLKKGLICIFILNFFFCLKESVFALAVYEVPGVIKPAGLTFFHRKINNKNVISKSNDTISKSNDVICIEFRKSSPAGVGDVCREIVLKTNDMQKYSKAIRAGLQAIKKQYSLKKVGNSKYEYFYAQLAANAFLYNYHSKENRNINYKGNYENVEEDYKNYYFDLYNIGKNTYNDYKKGNKFIKKINHYRKGENDEYFEIYFNLDPDDITVKLKNSNKSVTVNNSNKSVTVNNLYSIKNCDGEKEKCLKIEKAWVKENFSDFGESNPIIILRINREYEISKAYACGKNYQDVMVIGDSGAEKVKFEKSKELKFENKDGCETKLNSIIDNNDTVSRSSDLINLYNQWEFNGLLDFDSPTCSTKEHNLDESDTSCKTPLFYSTIYTGADLKNISTLENELYNNSYMYMDYHKNFVDTKTKNFAITFYNVAAGCYYYINMSNDFFSTAPTVLAGNVAFEKIDDNPLLTAELIVKCRMIRPTVADEANDPYENEIKDKINEQDRFKDNELLVSVDGKSLVNAPGNGFELNDKKSKFSSDGKIIDKLYSYKKTFNFKYSTKFDLTFEPVSGKIINSNNSNLYRNTEGIPTKLSYGENDEDTINNTQSKIIKIKTAFDGVDYETTCPYSVMPEMVTTPNGELNLKYRIIDKDNPFPGKEATEGGRKTGKNWCGFANNDLNDDGKTDATDALICLQNANDDYSKEAECVGILNSAVWKLNCSADNATVKNYITDRNDSHNSKNKTPIFSLTIDSKSIKNIKNYNKEHTYNEISNLSCKYGEKCKSQFVTDILNSSTYGIVNNSSCKSTGNRSYCTGTSS